MTNDAAAWLTTVPMDRQQELLARHEAFWRRETGSDALIGFAPNSRMFPLQNLNIDHEGRFHASDVTEAVMAADTEYRPPIDPADDLLPAKIPLEPLAWSEAYCGARVFVSSASQTVWAEPPSDIPQGVADLDAHIDHAWLDKLVQATQVNMAAADGHMLISETLLRGPADCLVSILGAEQLCLRAGDEPEAVATMNDRLADHVVALAKAQLEKLGRFHGGTVNRYRLWGPGENIVTQADISAVLSPRCFRDVFVPAYRRIAAAFDTATIHFHSAAAQHVDALLEIDELDAIEWGMDPTGATLEEMLPTFARILEHKCVILMNIRSDDEIKMLLNRLPHEGLCIIQRKDY